MSDINEPERTRILDKLSSFYAQDFLDMDEYERRVQAVMNAKTNQELQLINKDIISPRESGNAESPEAKDFPRRGQSISIFAGDVVQGRFKAPEYFDTISIFGGSKLDFREATIPPTGMTIDVAAVFGGVEILLPSDVEVETRVIAIFGGCNRPRYNSEHRKKVLIRGAAIFGGVEIKQF